MIDPKSLTPQERALVEEMLTRHPLTWGYQSIADPNGGGTIGLFNGWMSVAEWQQAYEVAIARIEAQRLVFLEPRMEVIEPGMEPGTCSVCLFQDDEHDLSCPARIVGKLAPMDLEEPEPPLFRNLLS